MQAKATLSQYNNHHGTLGFARNLFLTQGGLCPSESSILAQSHIALRYRSAGVPCGIVADDSILEVLHLALKLVSGKGVSGRFRPGELDKTKHLMPS